MPQVKIENGYPRVTNLLGALPAPVINPEGKTYRHPKGAFNTAMAKLCKRYEAVLDAIKTVVPEQFEPDNLPDLEMLLDAYEHFLYAQLEYIDDCRTIASIVFDPAVQKGGNKHERKFREKIEDYRRGVAAIVNAIKHNQGRLRAVWMHNDSILIPGYFVESPYPDGSVGPNPDLHDNGDTAISFYWDIRNNFVNIFQVAYELEKFVSSLTAGAIDIPEKNAAWIENARRIEALPVFCFLHETWKLPPHVRVAEGGKSTDIIVSIGEKPYKCLLAFSIRLAFQGDGVTNSFKMPFFSERWKKLVGSHLRRR